MDADWLSAISDAVSAAAVVAAGGFAYFRFVRGRTHRSNVDLHVHPDLVAVQESPALTVRTTMKNTGTLRLVLSPQTCRLVIEVFAVSDSVWSQANREGTVLWAVKVAEQNLLIDDMVPVPDITLEPGEVISDAVLLPIRPPAAYHAFQVRLTVEAPTRSLSRRNARPFEVWQTHSIIVV